MRKFEVPLTLLYCCDIPLQVLDAKNKFLNKRMIELLKNYIKKHLKMVSVKGKHLIKYYHFWMWITIVVLAKIIRIL